MLMAIIKEWHGASLVVQEFGIHLPMQGTQVRFLVQEDSTCHRATKPMSHSATALELTCQRYCLEPVLHNKRSHTMRSPRPTPREQPPLASATGSPSAATKTWHSQK